MLKKKIKVFTREGRKEIETKNISSFAPYPDGCVIRMRDGEDIFARNNFCNSQYGRVEQPSIQKLIGTN